MTFVKSLVGAWVFFVAASLSSLAAQAELSIQVAAPASEIQTQSVQRLSYNFGRVPVNTPRYVRFDVTNTGTIPLTFRDATISGIDYDAFHSCGGILPVGARCWFEIRYWPRFERFSSGRFTLFFMEDTGIVVDLWGEATPF